MDNAADSEVPSPIVPSRMSLQEIVASSIAIFFRRLVQIVVPGLLFFMVLTVLDLGVTALTGPLKGKAHTIAQWSKQIIFLLGFMVCTGLSIGFAGLAVLRDLDKKDAGVTAVFRDTLRVAGALISGTVLFNLIILAIGAPGGWAIYKAFGAVPNVLHALAWLLLGCILLYYPGRVVMDWLFFGFVILERHVGGWESLRESRRMMLENGGEKLKSPAFRAFLVLKIALVPVLVTYLGVLFLPLMAIALVVGVDKFQQSFASGSLNAVYALAQFLHSAAWGLMIPMFVVPLAVVYWDATRNRQAAAA